MNVSTASCAQYPIRVSEHTADAGRPTSRHPASAAGRVYRNFLNDAIEHESSQINTIDDVSRIHIRTARGENQVGASTVKLSPQPHSPVEFGLRKTKAALSPWRLKSISVPSTKGSACASTSTRTPS